MFTSRGPDSDGSALRGWPVFCCPNPWEVRTCARHGRLGGGPFRLVRFAGLNCVITACQPGTPVHVAEPPWRRPGYPVSRTIPARLTTSHTGATGDRATKKGPFGPVLALLNYPANLVRFPLTTSIRDNGFLVLFSHTEGSVTAYINQVSDLNSFEASLFF
jgi:hypothetical protein